MKNDKIQLFLNFQIVGFSQFSSGCIRKIIINGDTVDLQTLTKCPLDRVDDCQFEYCVNPEKEDCYKPRYQIKKWPK